MSTLTLNVEVSTLSAVTSIVAFDRLLPAHDDGSYLSRSFITQKFQPSARRKRKPTLLRLLAARSRFIAGKSTSRSTASCHVWKSLPFSFKRWPQTKWQSGTPNS